MWIHHQKERVLTLHKLLMNLFVSLDTGGINTVVYVWGAGNTGVCNTQQKVNIQCMGR